MNSRNALHSNSFHAIYDPKYFALSEVSERNVFAVMEKEKAHGIFSEAIGVYSIGQVDPRMSASFPIVMSTGTRFYFLAAIDEDGFNEYRDFFFSAEGRSKPKVRLYETDVYFNKGNTREIGVQATGSSCMFEEFH